MSIYLDNAASSCPKPPGVIEAVGECLRNYCANPGRGAHKTAVAAARVIYQSRQRAARFLGVKDSANLIFTMNATDALNLALYGMLEPGDHVVSSMVEHNAILRPLLVLQKAGVDVTLVGSDAAGRIDPDQVIDSLRPGTRLVALGHASNVTGAVQPIEQIAGLLREREVPLLLDAAQSAGTLHLDMEKTPVSMLACAGHKSLLGPQGIGLLYISPDIELKSIRQGGTGTHSEEPQDALARPDRYEAGTYNTPGIAGLDAGIKFLCEQGLDNIFSHKNLLTTKLYHGLKSIEGVSVYGPGDGEARGPLVSFNVGETGAAEVSGALDRDYDIASRAGLHCAPGAHDAMGTRARGAVRLSIGLFNTAADVDAAISAVSEIAAKALAGGMSA